MYGPESNLYELKIFYRKEKNRDIFLDKYNREYWFIGEDNESYIINKNIIQF